MTYSQADITVPYAVANFAEIRHKGYYYVDKTNYIPLLERYKAPVFSPSSQIWKESARFHVGSLLRP